MDWGMLAEDSTKILTALLILFGVGAVLAALLVGWVLWQVRRVKLPVGADFWTTLRFTPFSVVLLLDLLDFLFDFLSAPISWVILGRLGLTPLRGVSVVEQLVPGTQFLPTMIVAWLIARFFPQIGSLDIPPPRSTEHS